MIQWTANYVTVIAAAVYIRMNCVIETLHCWRKFEMCLV